MSTTERIVLLGVLAAIALAASLLAPALSPSMAQVNTHSVLLNMKGGSSYLTFDLSTGRLTVFTNGVPVETCLIDTSSISSFTNETTGVRTINLGGNFSGSCVGTP